MASDGDLDAVAASVPGGPFTDRTGQSEVSTDGAHSDGDIASFRPDR